MEGGSQWRERPQGWLSRVVKRTYGAVNCATGSAKMRREQLALPHMKRRTRSRITTPCAQSGRSFNLRR